MIVPCEISLLSTNDMHWIDDAFLTRADYLEQLFARASAGAAPRVRQTKSMNENLSAFVKLRVFCLLQLEFNQLFSHNQNFVQVNSRAPAAFDTHLISRDAQAALFDTFKAKLKQMYRHFLQHHQRRANAPLLSNKADFNHEVALLAHIMNQNLENPDFENPLSKKMLPLRAYIDINSK